MIQHGEGEHRFSAGGIVATPLPRPDRFDGCYNCGKRVGEKCAKYPEGRPGLNDERFCELWEGTEY